MTPCPEHPWAPLGRCDQCAAEARRVDHVAHAAEVKAAIKAARDKTEGES